MYKTRVVAKTNNEEAKPEESNLVARKIET